MIRYLLSVLTIFYTTFTFAQGPAPSFVLNVIAHVPVPHEAPEIDEDLRERVGALSFFIEKDQNTQYSNSVTPYRGKICAPQEGEPRDDGKPMSSVLGSLLGKLNAQTFGGVQEPGHVHDHIYVAALLNRMRSVNETYNDQFMHMRDDLPANVVCRVMSRLWEPRWKKEVRLAGNQKRYVNATFEEVKGFYEQLQESDPTLAQAFLHINEFQNLNAIVPYRELRELLLKSEITKSLVRGSRDKNPDSPVYLTFMDADTISLEGGGKETFQAYSDAVMSSDQIIHGMTTGYGVSVTQGAPVAMAVSLDLAVRRSLSEQLSLAAYFPEPNAAFRVLDDHHTLEVSFPGIAGLGHHKYESPKEVPLMIEALVNARFEGSKITASPFFRFLQEGEIETQAPHRFFKNKKGKDGLSSQKKFTGTWDEAGQFITGVTAQDLTNIRNTSQSHVKSRDWGGYVFGYFKELLKDDKSIRLVEGNRPGSVISKRKDHLLTSLFASLQSSYSPIAITLREVKQHGYNVIEYMFDLLKNFEKRTPTALAITYGNTGAVGTKRVGSVLRDRIKSYEALGTVIDKFYSSPVFNRVYRVAQLSGRSEIPVLICFLQRKLVVQVPQALPALKRRIHPRIKFEAHNQPIIPVHYPEVSMTLQRIKELIRALYTYKSYKDLDQHAGLANGNCSRIVNGAKQLSPNVKKVWQAFQNKTWVQVQTALSLSDDAMARLARSSLDEVKRAQNREGVFIDTFFYLRDNNARANAA